MTLLAAIAVGVGTASLALALVAPRLSLPRIDHPDRPLLAIAAPELAIVRWEAIRWAVTLAAFAALSPFGVAPIGLAAAVVPSVGLRMRVAALRDRAASRSLEVLQATHAALRSGLPLAPALRAALERTEPLARDPFERALRSLELNAPFAHAFSVASQVARDRRVELALDALALVASEALPASRAAAVVGSVADRLAFEEQLRGEVRARTSGVRAQIVLLALLVPALAFYLGLSMPGLAATLASPLGSHVLVPAALLFELAGIVASRAVVSGIAR